MIEDLIKALKVRLKQFNGEPMSYRIHDGHHIRDILTVLAVLEGKPNAEKLLENMPY